MPVRIVRRGGRASNAPQAVLTGLPHQAQAGKAAVGVTGFDGTCFITNPGPVGWPDATNTGTLGAALTTINVGTGTWRTSIDGAGLFTTQVIGGNSYRVYTNKAFVLSTGSVYVDNPYVMFDHCSFTSSGATFCMVQLASGGVCQTLRAVDCNFDGGPFTNRGIAGDDGHIVVLRLNATRTGEAAVEKNDRNGLWDFTVTDSYIHDNKGWISGQHVDGLQFGGARNVTIQHNSIWIEPYRATDGNTSDVSNSCIGGWSELGNVSGNILIDNNQMAGGGSVIYCEQKAPWTMQGTVTISNNVFVRNHFPSLQGSNYTPATGHAAVWFVLAPPGRPASLSGAGTGWINNKWEDGTICTLAEAIVAANNGQAPPLTVPPRPDIANAPAASDIVLWLGLSAIDDMNDAGYIDLRDNWGITSIVCQFSYLYTMGGGQRHNAPVSGTFNAADGRAGTEWLHCRSIRYGNTGTGTAGLGNIVNRLHNLGMKIYAGTRLFNLNNRVTPLVHWTDDAAWAALVSPSNLALAEHITWAKTWGFDGIAFDDEPIGFVPPDPEPTWGWQYSGNGQNETTTRAKVRQRGAELGALFVSLWPDMNIIEYNTTGTGGFPSDWDADFAQSPAGKLKKEASTQRDLWDGVFSNAGFTGNLRFASSIFYKGTSDGATWFGAEQYNAVSVCAFLSRNWTSWNRAHTHFFIQPMHWPGRAGNPAGGEDFPSTLATIQASWAASRIMGMGNIVFYTQTITSDNIYFTTAMKDVFRAARVPGTVNTVVPTLSAISATGRSGNNITLSGTAGHPLGIRYVEWEVYNAAGTAVESTGAFGHTFVLGTPGNHQSATGYINATYPFDKVVSAPVGRKVRVTAVSIKGQSHSTVVQL